MHRLRHLIAQEDDSQLVGVAKPDPRIFEFALPHFDGVARSRIAYIGDSVTMDIGGARAAGLYPIGVAVEAAGADATTAVVRLDGVSTEAAAA